MLTSFHSLALAGAIAWLVMLSLTLVGYLFRLQIQEWRTQRRLKAKRRLLELRMRFRRHAEAAATRSPQWEPGAWLVLGHRLGVLHHKTVPTVQNLDGWSASASVDSHPVWPMQNAVGQGAAAVNC